jgi:hypothetical protein
MKQLELASQERELYVAERKANKKLRREDRAMGEEKRSLKYLIP